MQKVEVTEGKKGKERKQIIETMRNVERNEEGKEERKLEIKEEIKEERKRRVLFLQRSDLFIENQFFVSH